MDWLRWWHGTVNDPKFQRVARMAGASTGDVIAVWACLLERASSVTQRDAAVTRGSVTGFDCDDHDVLLGLEEGRTARILAALEDRGMIIDGRIARWDERQPKREDSSAARTEAYRKRQREARNATPSDAHVTQGDAPERDTEGDKSNNPLNPPAGEKAKPAKPKLKPKAEPKPKPEPKAASSRSKPKRPLPLPFLMTPEMLAWAAEEAPAVNLDRETEDFIDYWTGVGKPMADWPATWRNRMRRRQDDLERRGLAKPVKKDPNDTTWIDEDDGV